MRKIYVLSLFTFLCVQLSVAQFDYDKKWKKVEDLELEGKFASAQKVVERIYKEANATQQTEQIVKSFIYRAKFALFLTEDSEVAVLQSLRAEIDQQAFPANAILENMYARLLTQYARKYQYKISSRSEVVSETIPSDVSLWDIKTFVTEIHKHFQHSIAREDELLQLPVEKYMTLLEGKPTMKIYRASLYEILAHNALNFYKTDIPYAYKSDESYTISAKDFSLTEAFTQRIFEVNTEQVFAMNNTLRLFQKLDKIALKNTNAHVDIVLQRFLFLYAQILTEPRGNAYYIDALKQLAKKYQANPLEALINFQLASHYLDISELYHYNSYEKPKELRTKAIALTKEMTSKYPNSEGGIKCELLQKKIEQKSIHFTTEQFSIPNKPTLASVKIKNVDTLFLKAYRIPHTFLEDKNYATRDSLIGNFIKNKKAVLSKSYHTNIPKDYYEHITEIAIPALPKGKYLIVLSDNAKGNTATGVFSFNFIQKTNLSEIITEFKDKQVHTILNRATGKPVYKARIKISDKKRLINQIERTNIYGQATINKRSSYRTIKKFIIHEGDTLYTAAVSLNKKYRKKDDEEESYWEAKPFVFTDRAIYRPGQTVHFKTVVIQQKNGVSSVVPNVFCEIEIDSDDSEIKLLRLKTNEFGSFSGSFKIPKNSPTGDFTIRVDEDLDYEEDDHPFWDFIDQFHYTEHTFKVEEYKRPRFEVTVDAMNNNISFNDTIKVTGNAKALLGSAVTNAKVAYKISRYANMYKYGNEDKTKVIAEAVTTTDEKGNFSIPFVATLDSKSDLKNMYAYEYTVSIEVTDINGETQTAEKMVSVSTKGFDLVLNVPQKSNKNQPLNIKIATKDLNEIDVAANGSFKIYKLKNSTRVLKKRPWSTPEYHIIPKETFVQQFPNMSYNSAEEVLEKETKVSHITFNTGEKSTFNLNTSTWKSGSYIIETVMYDEKIKDSVAESKNFLLIDPKDQYLANNALFDHEILNSDFKNDGFLKLKLATALRDDALNVFVQAFHESKQVFSRVLTIEKGSEILDIPLSKQLTNDVTIRMSFVKFNTFYKDEFTFHQYEEKKFLTVETATFRNKLQPGQKETWRFKILDLEKNPSNAEVLASMYDESLDQFQPHNWDVNFDRFHGKYYSTPQTNSTGFNTKRSHEVYNLNNYFKIPIFKKHLKFKWFGLSFRNFTNTNNQYLGEIKRQRKYKNKTVYTGSISGYVVDDNGIPLPGASVLIKGTEIGTTTDFDGLYSLDATPEDVLVISYVGFSSEEIKVGNQKAVSARLTVGNALESVALVAYGISEIKSTSAAGVTLSVNGESVRNVPIGTLDQILQGASAGVNINTASGQSGTNATITIRGRGSLQGDIEPLFIIDGVPVDQNVFRNLSDKNITSLSVLKDAQATALYGNRGAGGVILVTTKYGTRKEMDGDLEVIVGLTEEDLDMVDARTNLKETAFFYPHLRTDAAGNVAVEFEAPESLTRWKFQLFAHQKNGMFEMLTKNAVTQKELMVVPNMPRFLREKDTIVISTKVVNLQKKTTKGIASLRLFDATTMESIDAKTHLSEKNKSFTVDAKGNTTVSWKLYIPQGVDAIQYKVIAKAENFSDGEESVLPVLKNSILITEAKPILVKAGQQKEITFSKLANTSSESLQQHQLTLEYTSNPTWSAIQSLPYLMEYPYECAEQTFARLYANMLAAHILQSSPKIQEVFEAWKANGQLISDLEKNPELKSLLISETPWVRDAASESEKKQQLAKLFDKKALNEMQLDLWYTLDNLQTKSGGFPWFAGGNENYYITLHILQTFAHLVQLDVLTEATEKKYYNSIMKAAYKYADERFLVAHATIDKAPKDAAYTPQIEYIYTRTMTPEFMEIPKDVKTAMVFYLDHLRKNWLLLSVNQKAMLALSLARMDKQKDAKKIMTALEESAVKSEENGMYWKSVTENRYYNSSAVETQALLIEAFAEITKDDKMVQELQLWLLQQKQYNRWTTTKSTTKAVYALLLNPKSFVSIKDNTKFTIGTEKISTKKLDETAKEAGTGYFKTSWKKDEVTKDKATIRIKNNGKTTGFGAVYWQYFEELDKITQNEEATLQISKELYVTETRNGKEVLVPLATKKLKIGDEITVRLTIKNQKEAEFIHLKDMRAAGLEPINVLSEYKWQDGVGYYESTRDTSTNFFFDRIPKGTFILEYNVRVNNTGAFSNGITTIESMYAPELRSHTKGIRIKVD
ncbi:MG2 domain-containing protein [Kordia sp.]|uniref:alpha-2-macroglobulin family protein n=1 Tax=Kordia sp. TaxID=1965332 RepID=UPI003D6AD2EC